MSHSALCWEGGHTELLMGSGDRRKLHLECNCRHFVRSLCSVRPAICTSSFTYTLNPHNVADEGLRPTEVRGLSKVAQSVGAVLGLEPRSVHTWALQALNLPHSRPAP